MAIIVSDAAAEESLQAYTNPLSIQAKALDDLSEKVLSGAVVSDGNNPFTFLTEFASNMTATVVNKACECFNGLYPANAQTATELYKHLSDFDYIGLYASPATTTVELVIDRNFLIDNAVDINTDAGFNEDPTRISGNYSKIVLPSYSKFMIGDYIFGLMYPIEIRVRKAIKDGSIDYENSVITVVWDTSYQNPLMPLTSHILEHRDFLQEGQMLTAIEVPIYQFEVANYTENAIASTGFAKRYDFLNKFYAVRVFHFKNGEWNEMAQTFSDTKYDADIPTAIIKVLADLGKVEVVIPHIYFNSKDSATTIGNRILVKVYTTLGELNVDLSEYSTDQLQASFLLTDTNLVEDDRYSNMLKRIPTVYLIPESTKIASGSNGLTFGQLKERVKYNDSYTVQITPSDLNNYFSLSGYKFTKELDNITDRVYCAHKILKDGTGAPIASGQGMTYLGKDALTFKSDDEDSTNWYVPGYSNISVYAPLNDVTDETQGVTFETITILPSAVYKYDEETNKFYMLSDGDLENIMTQSLENRINTFNTTLYTYSPFHTVLSFKHNDPIAGTYDLFKPTLRDRVFSWENDLTTAEVSVYDAKIEPRMEGERMAGYRLLIDIYKTANLEQVESVSSDKVENIKLMLSTSTNTQSSLYLMGEYIGVDESTGKDCFEFRLDSDFRISETGDIFISSFWNGLENQNSEAATPYGGMVHIGTQDYTVSLLILDSKLEEATGETVLKGNTIEFGLPNSLNDYTLLCRQSFKVKLGDAVPLLQNNVTVSTTDIQYQTYNTTQFATYQAPVYYRWTIEDCVNGLCTEEQIGLLRLDENKKPVIKHNSGDVILSSQYNICYGPTLTLTVGSEHETLELQYDEALPITATSDKTNVFGSLDGDLFVYSNEHPELTGVYKIKNRFASKFKREWNQEFITYVEIFDTSILTYPALYKTEENGQISFSETPPTRKLLRSAGLRSTTGGHIADEPYKDYMGGWANLDFENTQRIMLMYLEDIPTYSQQALNGEMTPRQYYNYCSLQLSSLVYSIEHHFTRLTTKYLYGSYESDASQICVASDWVDVSKFIYLFNHVVRETAEELYARGMITENGRKLIVDNMDTNIYDLSNRDRYGNNDSYRAKLCIAISENWVNGSVSHPNYSRYHLNPNWMNLQTTMTKMDEFIAYCKIQREAFRLSQITIEEYYEVVDRFCELMPSVARHWYHLYSRDTIAAKLGELLRIYNSIPFPVMLKYSRDKYGWEHNGITKEICDTFWQTFQTRSVQAMFITEDDIMLNPYGTPLHKTTEDIGDTYYGNDLNYSLIGLFTGNTSQVGYTLSDNEYFVTDMEYDKLNQTTPHDVWYYMYFWTNHSNNLDSLYSSYITPLYPEPSEMDQYTRNICKDQYEGWVSETVSQVGRAQWWAIYNHTYGYIESIDMVLEQSQKYYKDLDNVYIPTSAPPDPDPYDPPPPPPEPDPYDPEPDPEPYNPDPEPEPEPEPEPVEGLPYYSSNHPRIQLELAGIEPLRKINTTATGYDRKWYLITTDESTFNFETYTGLVIEYGPTGLDDSGLTKSWNLSYYYSIIDEQTHEVSVESIVIATNLDMEGSPLSENDIEQLIHDPYVKGYVSRYHRVEYESLPGGRRLLLGPADGEPIYSAACTEGVVMKDENGKPVEDENKQVIYYITPKQDPWTVTWKAADGNPDDVPVVENISQTTYQHRIRTVDALEFIAGYISVLGTHSESYLYRSLTTSDVLADPLADQMFVAVFNTTDGRSAPALNEIGYAPTEVNEQGEVVPVIDEDVSPDPIEVGTRTAKGALYYRDPEATAFDYSVYGLDMDMMYTICKLWSDRHANGKTDNQIYDEIIKQFKIDHPTIVLNYTLLRKIVSNTDSCYFSPWKKLVTCSSANAIQHYVDYLSDARIDPYSDLFGAHAGYISIMEANIGEGELTNYVPHYINLVSIVDRTISGENTEYTTHEFVINPEDASWNEIDHWPWEYEEPWICTKELTTEDQLFATRPDITIDYNSTLSCTKVLHAPGDVDLREGEAKVAEDRHMVYGVDMIHCDYKLKLSEDAAYANYMEDIRDLLRAYFNELKAITPSLLARTKLYFAPIRTFGSAEFKGSSGSIQTLPVQFSTEFGLHVEAYVKNSTLNKETIRTTILNLIDKDMLDGTINLAVLAKDISKELGDNVVYVDVLGLNGDKSQQTMIPVSDDTYPQLKQVLTIYEDNTVHVDRALSLDWYVIN